MIRVGAKLKGGGKLPLTAIGGILAVVGFGLVVVIGSSHSSSGTPAILGSQTEVLVAARDLPLRTPIAAGDLTTVKMGVGDVPPGAFSRVADLKGLVTAVSIPRGQAVTANLVVSSPDLVGESHDYLPIPSGYVLLQVPTGEIQGAGGYIQAGDYIAMTVILAPKGISTVRTVYTNLHVLKIGAATPDTVTAPVDKLHPRTGGVVTSMSLLVTQCQSEYINWFLANAQIKFTLQSYRDYKPGEGKPDPACPTIDAAQGVSKNDINAHWAGLAG